MKTRLRLALCLLMSAVFFVSVFAGKTPAPSTTKPVISFALNGDLWVMDEDGANPSKVLLKAGFDPSLSGEWSPEGDRLYFFGCHAPGYIRGFYSINLAGDDLLFLNISVQAAPHISPFNMGLGPKIVFNYPADAQFFDPLADLNNSTFPDDIWVMDALNPPVLDKTGNWVGLDNLTNTPEINERSITWSPDGSRLAVLYNYVVSEDPYRTESLIRVLELATDGSGQFMVMGNPITVNENARDTAGIIYPTNITQIVWSNCDNDVNQLVDTVVARTDTNDLLLLKLYPPYGKQPVFSGSEKLPGLAVLSPTWSPDSSKIAFEVRGDRKRDGIYKIDAYGSEPQKLISGECRFPRWYRYVKP